MVEHQVQEVLQKVSFHVLLLSVSKVLSREGYSDVELLGRRTTRQKSYLGGCDLVARQPLGVFQTKSLVKVIQDNVRLRMLDEMSGAMPRCKANFGIIVTPFGCTKQVRDRNASYPGHPIRIVDGAELANLMVKHRIGVREQFGTLCIDEGYFEALRDRSGKLLTFLKNADKELR